jgi:hypothetical protein
MARHAAIIILAQKLEFLMLNPLQIHPQYAVLA